MKLFTTLSSLTVTLLTLGSAVAHTVEEAYHDVELLKGTCLAAKDKLCAITPEHAEGGGFVCIHLRDLLRWRWKKLCWDFPYFDKL